MKYVYLPWDSINFGYKVALLSAGIHDELELDATLKVLQNRNYRLAYFFLPTDHKLNTHVRGFNGLLVDQKITYQKQISKTQGLIKGNNRIIPYYSTLPLQSVIDLAIESGKYSRFRTDPNFRNNEFEILYRKWILKSIKKQAAFEVLICLDEYVPVGLITLVNKKGMGDIGLVAVDKNYQGRGIGVALMRSAEALFMKNLFFNIQVVTQKQNLAACKLYEKCGFSETSLVNVYHFWLK